MKKLIIPLSFLTLLVAMPVFAQQSLQTITLKDGTTLKGQLVSVTDGFYTINTPNVGQVKVSAQQILSISAAGANAPLSPAANLNERLSSDTVNSIKTNMLQDPEIMSLMQELVQDPSVAEMLKDPSLMQDALSMDPSRVQNNTQVQKLIQNPTMQKILKLTAQKLQNTQEK